ncbi:hypothetical protein C7271_02070, partial [filamentous cyanobacterium CCP5]
MGCRVLALDAGLIHCDEIKICCQASSIASVAMTLLEALQTVPDYRQARGQRHPLWIILVFILMGNLAGYQGNRPLEEFAKRYGSEVA